MNRLTRHTPSPAMIVALIALFVALGGAAYAGVTLSNNSVRSTTIVNGQVKTVDLANSAVTNAKLKNNAVNSAKVKDGSLNAVDLTAAAQAALKGNNGATGATGAQGPAGPGAKWILVAGDGTRVLGSAGVTVSSKPFVGEYRIDFGEPTSGKLVLATISERDNSAAPVIIQATPCGAPGPTTDGYTNCVGAANVNRAAVLIRNANTNVSQDHSFYLALIP